MYGTPNVPSGYVRENGPVMFSAIASVRKLLGKAAKPSCTEHDQFDRLASVRPARAGWVATMCASL